MDLPVPVRWWACPACTTRDRTQRPEPHTQFHNCPALGGLGIPLVEVASPDSKPKARQVVVEAEDYVEHNNPVTAVRTERADGSNDCTVFPSSATAAGASRYGN